MNIVQVLEVRQKRQIRSTLSVPSTCTQEHVLRLICLFKVRIENNFLCE